MLARASMRMCRDSARAPTLEEIRKNGYVLTPGRYVGAEAAEEDGEPFEEKMQRLTAKLGEQFSRVGTAGGGDPG